MRRASFVIDGLNLSRSLYPHRVYAALPCAASRLGKDVLQSAMLAFDLMNTIIEVIASMRQDRYPPKLALTAPGTASA
jgi:hypothetical protein